MNPESCLFKTFYRSHFGSSWFEGLRFHPRLAGISVSLSLLGTHEFVDSNYAWNEKVCEQTKSLSLGIYYMRSLCDAEKLVAGLTKIKGQHAIVVRGLRRGGPLVVSRCNMMTSWRKLHCLSIKTLLPENQASLTQGSLTQACGLLRSSLPLPPPLAGFF